MKRILYTLLVATAIFLTTSQASAQARYPAPYNQVRLESFFYYPKSNVYFSFRTRQYIYPSRGSWETAYRLPHYIRVGREDRLTVEHRGFDVWNDNAMHQYTYGRRYHPSPAVVYVPEKRYDGY